MPAVNEKQREAMAIAEHHPSDLYARNKGMAKMSHEQLHEFATKTEHDGYPHKVAHKIATGA